MSWWTQLSGLSLSMRWLNVSLFDCSIPGDFGRGVDKAEGFQTGEKVRSLSFMKKSGRTILRFKC